MRTKLVIIILTILIAMFFLNIETNTKKGVNYKINEEPIYLYIKIYDFFNRHQYYKKTVKRIFDNDYSIIREDINENKIYHISQWLFYNIKKNTNEIIVDFHPTTIIERGLGTSDQLNDINSILLVYENYESFYKNIYFNEESYPFTFVKVYDEWTIIDPYNGLYFTNNNKFASIKNIKDNNFEIIKINTQNNSNSYIFFEKIISKNELEKKINNIFINFDTEKEIYKKNKFIRGGRSYFQDPLNRLIYEVYKYFNLI